MAEPMTDVRRSYLGDLKRMPFVDTTMHDYVDECLTEIDRLREENEQLQNFLE